MTWVKLPDTFTEEFEDLGEQAMAVHVAGLCFSNRQGTDGHISKQKALSLFPLISVEAAIGLLVQHGFWKPVGDGYQIVRHVDDQPSGDEIARRRGVERVRQRRHRLHMSGDHSICDPERCKALLRERDENDVT